MALLQVALLQVVSVQVAFLKPGAYTVLSLKALTMECLTCLSQVSVLKDLVVSRPVSVTNSNYLALKTKRHLLVD